MEHMLAGEDDIKLNVAMKYMTTLKDFRSVVHSCFGMRDLDPRYEDNIQKFSSSYRALNISVTVKVHLVERHLADFLKYFGEEHSLGFYSEQAMESLHDELRSDLRDEQMVVKDHPRCGEKLVNLACRVNGKHM